MQGRGSDRACEVVEPLSIHRLLVFADGHGRAGVMRRRGREDDARRQAEEDAARAGSRAKEDAHLAGRRRRRTRAAAGGRAGEEENEPNRADPRGTERIGQVLLPPKRRRSLSPAAARYGASSRTRRAASWGAVAWGVAACLRTS